MDWITECKGTLCVGGVASGVWGFPGASVPHHQLLYLRGLGQLPITNSSAQTLRMYQQSPKISEHYGKRECVFEHTRKVPPRARCISCTACLKGMPCRARSKGCACLCRAWAGLDDWAESCAVSAGCAT